MRNGSLDVNKGIQHVRGTGIGFQFIRKGEEGEKFPFVQVACLHIAGSASRKWHFGVRGERLSDTFLIFKVLLLFNYYGA